MVEDGASTECVFPPKGRDTPPRCDHGSVERLGVDAGNNQYFRCRDCEAVVVTFTPDDQWERQRELLSAEDRNWNPLLDALRGQNDGPDADPRREDTRVEESLAARVRARWRRFWAD